jgi:hypothetical protein
MFLTPFGHIFAQKCMRNGRMKINLEIECLWSQYPDTCRPGGEHLTAKPGGPLGPIYPHVACWHTERVKVRGFSSILLALHLVFNLFSLDYLRRSFEMNVFWAQGPPCKTFKNDDPYSTFGCFYTSEKHIFNDFPHLCRYQFLHLFLMSFGIDFTSFLGSCWYQFSCFWVMIF